MPQCLNCLIYSIRTISYVIICQSFYHKALIAFLIFFRQCGEGALFNCFKSGRKQNFTTVLAAIQELEESRSYTRP